MKIWVHYSAPAFTGQSFFRVWLRKPKFSKGANDYFINGYESPSFRVGHGVAREFAKLCGSKLKDGKKLTKLSVPDQFKKLLTLMCGEQP